VGCHTPSVSGVQSSASMLELSVGGEPSPAPVDTVSASPTSLQASPGSPEMLLVSFAGLSSVDLPCPEVPGAPLYRHSLWGGGHRWTSSHVTTPPGLCFRSALEIRLWF